ncbi:MAG: carboxypeptidase-like regulatory domain-containing protein, partial [Cyclobacteriaceae bacterium]
MRKFLLLVSSFVLMSSLVWAQGRTITGKVTASEDGSPLPGVNVLVKGTTGGTVTDANGSYTVSVPSEGATLVFSFIGYVSQEVEVGARKVVDVAMEADVEQLSEVVVTGYGSQLKQDLTGNIARVKGDELKTLPVQSFEQAIQGRAAGVFVETGNGKLGQGVKVRIRGASSVTADNQPLYVIDGVV